VAAPAEVVAFSAFICDDFGERLNDFNLGQQLPIQERLALDAKWDHLQVNDFHDWFLAQGRRDAKSQV
jgi:hypothetical protein